ncbi:MAG: RsbRD N-terminal domain-containing protein [Planctomycetota bacterium]
MEETLKQKRDEIVRGWIEAALAIFPVEARTFFANVADPFANPAGCTISTEIGRLFDAVARDAPDEELDPPLDRIVQITCLQDAAPSQGIAFVFALRETVRRALASARDERGVLEGLREFEPRIDRLALRAFDRHARLRQRIADLRVQEVRGRVSTLVKMAGMDWDDLPSSTRSQGDWGR